MADTLTPVHALVKPEISGSDDTWGNKLNSNFDKLDGFFKNGVADRVQIKNGANPTIELRANATGGLEIYSGATLILRISATGTLQTLGDIEAFAGITV